MKRILSLIVLSLFLFTGCSAEKTINKSSENETTSVSSKAESISKSETTTSSKASSTTKAPEETKAPKELPKIQKGKVSQNNYINSSLGFKIIPPDGWEYHTDEEMDSAAPELSKYGDENEEYFIAKITEIPSGYDIKSMSVSVNLNTGMKSLDDYKKYVEDSFNDDPDYMHTEYKGFKTIGNRDYLHIKFVYPQIDYVYSDLFVCFENGAMVYIDFSQLTEAEIEDFLSNSIENL